AQGPMHRRPALGGIHRLTAKQSVDPVRQLLLASQIEQPLEGFHGQTLLGVVEQQRTAFAMQTPEALRIIGEELCQMGVLDVIGMLSQDPPHITYSPEMDRHTAKPKPPANRRSTRPGCQWCLPGTLICARFVRVSHRGRCCYSKKPKPAPEPVGAHEIGRASCRATLNV